MTLEYRVYGPPGTGKTTWLAKKATEMASEFGSDQISICSLTRAAVREVVGRDLDIPDGNITTLHARCKRALHAESPAEDMVRDFAREHPEYSTEDCLPPGLVRGLNTKSEDDEVSIAGKGLTMYEKANILRQQLVPRERWPTPVAIWLGVWEEWCQSEDTLDFTGWLESCRSRPEVLPQQEVLFVDEAQDHTPLQLEVIRAWGVGHRFLIGDDDQNLYEWSGAVPQRFLNYEIPSSQEMVLSQSYRVPNAVHRVATKWISQVRFRKAKDYRPRDHEGEVVHSGYRIADAQHGMLPDGIERPGRSVMILTSCGYMLQGLIATMRLEGIPFHNPYRRSDAKWNPLSGAMLTLRSLVIGDRDWTGHEVKRWATALAEHKAFRVKKKTFLEEAKLYASSAFPTAMIEESLKPDAYAMVMAQDPVVFERMRPIGVTGVVDWGYAMRVVSKYGIDVEPWVTIGTIHSVKGGEADEVILFPDLSPDGFSEYITHDRRDRVLRLFYVGMTRAKDRLVLCDVSSRNAVDWI